MHSYVMQTLLCDLMTGIENLTYCASEPPVKRPNLDIHSQTHTAVN